MNLHLVRILRQRQQPKSIVQFPLMLLNQRLLQRNPKLGNRSLSLLGRRDLFLQSLSQTLQLRDRSTTVLEALLGHGIILEDFARL